MANAARSYNSNVAGTFFVDDTCIDCDLCRQIAPEVFEEHQDHSIVYRQPESGAAAAKAAMALVACPTGSIGTRSPVDIRAAIAAFPENVEENVYFCGYASRESFGAASYLIVHPDGNILVDSPRFARNLVRKLEDLGGVSRMFLTHRDDVADHELFHRHFGCTRIIHKADAGATGAEEQFDGNARVQLAPDLLAVPVPGHTRGHAVLLYRGKYLFSGDHLAWSIRRGGLTAFRRACWYSWREQIASMERMLDLEFEWVLPGHGRRAHLPPDRMRRELADCVEWMRTV